MSQGFADEAAAFEIRLKAGFTALPIAWQGVAFSPPSGSGYVTATILSGEGRQISLQSPPRKRWAGVFQVDVYTPETQGARLGRAHADTIGDLFDGVQFSAGSSGVIITRVPAIIQMGAENGRFRTVVTIPFQRSKI